jgi:hypothetical protein
MGLENFIPQVWAAKLFVRLRKNLVYGDVVNHDYEGDITRMGDTVRINEIGPITVSDYTKYGALTWQALSSAQKVLIIDQAKAFSFAVDDVDVAQINPKIMNDAMSEASYAIADTIDQFIAGLYAQAGATPSATTYIGAAGGALSVSSGNAIETLTYAARYLSEKNVPEQNRWIVIPPWMHQKLLLAETGTISAIAVPKINNGDVVPGYVGSGFGFSEVRVSNNVSVSSTEYRVMCGDRSAISYAGQVSKVKAVERESYFDEGIKGLYVYGAKVVRPEALLTIYLAEAAG